MIRNTAVAQAFARSNPAKLGNAETDGRVYRLFGNPICRFHEGRYEFNWCGHWTQSTARHINFILGALGSDHRVGYAKSRDAGINTFVLDIGEL
jgi:hypothetical protein